MWKIPKIWENGQCIILGGGPSLPKQFGVPQEVIDAVYAGKVGPEVYSPYMSVLYDKHIIAVNMAYKIGPWIDCVFFGDSGFAKLNNFEVLKFKGLKVTSADQLEKYSHVLKIVGRDRKKPLGITDNPNLLSWNFNSGGAAINLAYHFGVKKIILLGFDMKLDAGNNQHWHKYYVSNQKTVQATMKQHLKGFPHIANDLKGKIEILNCSPVSAITVFPKVSIKEALNE